MGRIWSESGAIREIQQHGFLNCFATSKGRCFIISSVPLSREGSRVRYSVGRSLMLARKVELVTGDSFAAAYRLRGVRDAD
jgi:hypothetical protein